jgi:hypothetical protein
VISTTAVSGVLLERNKWSKNEITGNEEKGGLGEKEEKEKQKREWKRNKANRMRVVFAFHAPLGFGEQKRKPKCVNAMLLAKAEKEGDEG